MSTGVSAMQRAMLTHAAVTYCGFHLTPTPEKSSQLKRLMSRLLNELEPTREQKWDIVWGPATFNLGFTGFDDAAMYLAQSRQQPTSFVIAVRGTNPISQFDWVFGDLMAARKVPWSYAREKAPGAAISFSTALGLSIAQHMRWEPSTPDVASTLWHNLTAGFDETLRSSSRFLRERLESGLAGPMRELRQKMQDETKKLRAITASLTPDTFDAWADSIHQRYVSHSARALLGGIDDALARLEGTRFDPLRLILGGTALRSTLESGSNLQSFLRAAVAALPDGAKIDIHVTGHSKGGALSPTLALWLAETQGSEGVFEEERWDPDRKATVHAHAFAGPTAGNEAFATHSNDVIGERCYSTINSLDIVPHAWAVDTLSKVAGLYELPRCQRERLDALMVELIGTVRDIDYRHIGNHVTKLPGKYHERPFLEQVIHQHLDGYFEQMDLSNGMSTRTFFDVLA